MVGSVQINSGQRFGNLTVNSVSSVAEKKCKYASCTCDCGKSVQVRTQDLLRSKTKSCGCFSKERRRLFLIQSHEDRMLELYKYHAARNKREFTLDEEYAKFLFKQPCTYCGSLPFRNTRSMKPLQIPTNGIDRIDNKLGYIPGNVVTACTVCNMMKHKLGVQEFLEQSARIAKHNSWWSKVKRYLRANLWCSI